MNKKYIVRLTKEERRDLLKLVSTGTAPAYRIRNANVLLKADADACGLTDEEIAVAFSCHPMTVQGIGKRFVLQGLEAAIERKKHVKPRRDRTLDGNGEAQLIALSLSEPPEGFSTWTLRLLSEKLVELEVVDSVSHETVRRTLKKMNSDHT